MKLRSVIFLVALNVISGFGQEEYCYANDGDKKQTKHYSTKTPYEIARGTDRKYFTVPKCEPVKFWLLSRHGTRNPSEKGIKQLSDLVEVRDAILENFKRYDRDRHLNQLCADDLEQLKKWRFDRNLTADFAEYLTVQGWNDLKYMAIDFQRSFQNLIEPRYSSEKFKFRYTSTQRTEASYKAFIEGLFGPGADGIVHTDPERNGSILLRPYEFCPEFEKQEARAKDNSSEYAKFMQTNVYKKTLEEISIRLGYKYTMSPKQVDTIWDMCRYDQAWYLQDDSPWCAAFTHEHVNVLEYAEDLKYYYKASYGSPLSKNMMCAAVKDMVMNMRSEDNPKVVAYFSHASAIQLFLTALGYAKDNDALRADNYGSMKYRKFRASVVSPFASNIAVVKYDCPYDDERHKVQFFLNEKPIEFNWCNVGLCNLSKLVEVYRNYLEADCQKIYCGENSGVSVQNSTVLVLALAAVLWFFQTRR